MSVASISGEKRVFSLQEARELLPVVKKITTGAVERANDIVTRLDDIPEDDPEFDEMRAALDQTVRSWAEKMEKLGCEVKGLWLVDFNNGQGYYCWRFGEDELDHFHDYDEGFASRTRIC